jgi:D-alanine-D-alanine ligase
MKWIKIALLVGGWSAEREVSLKSGESVARALDKHKYQITVYDPRDGLEAIMKLKGEIDVVFNLLHGRFGEDGCIQGLLSLVGIPFVGSGVLSSALALNKKTAKILYRSAGLKIAKDVVLSRDAPFSIPEIIKTVGPETVVKPVAEGSSVGISVCFTGKELRDGISKAFRHSPQVMVEEYLSGREMTCCVVGNQVLESLPPIEIVPAEHYRFFEYEAKYQPGATKEICPAALAPALTEKVKHCAMKAHQVLGCEVWSRTDMILKGRTVYLLETNTIPGMTDNSLFPLAARAAGMSISDLLDRLISLSLEPGRTEPPEAGHSGD